MPSLCSETLAVGDRAGMGVEEGGEATAAVFSGEGGLGDWIFGSDSRGFPFFKNSTISGQQYYET